MSKTPGRGPTLTDRTIGAGIWVLSGTGVQAALRLAVLSILARLLGPSEFGLAAAAMVVTAFCRILLKTGIRPALVQRPDLEERHESVGFWLSIAIGIGFAAGIATLAGPIARDVFLMPKLAPVLQAIVLVLPLQSLGVVARSMIERELRFSVTMRLEVIAYLLGYAGVGISLAFAGYGVWALVGAYIGQELVLTTLLLYMHPHSKSLRWDRQTAGELLHYGTGYAAAAFGNVAAIQGDNWVVGRWLGQQSLGFYKYAYELTAMVAGLLGQVLQQVLFPAMAKVQGDEGRLAAAYRRGVGLISLLVLPSSAWLFVTAPELVELILGPEWDGTVGPFRVLSLALLVRTTYRVSDALARATGAVYQRAWRHWVHAAAIMGLAWVGQHWGLTALSIGVAAGMTVNFFLMAQLATRLASVTWRDVAVAHLGALPSFLVSLATVLASVSLGRDAGLPPIATAGLSLLAVGAIGSLGLRWRPRWFLGPDGVEAVGLLVQFIDHRYPRLLDHALVRYLLPLRIASEPGR